MNEVFILFEGPVASSSFGLEYLCLAGLLMEAGGLQKALVYYKGAIRLKPIFGCSIEPRKCIKGYERASRCNFALPTNNPIVY